MKKQTSIPSILLGLDIISFLILKILILTGILHMSQISNWYELCFIVISIPLFIKIRYNIEVLLKRQVENQNRMDAINKSNAVIEFGLDGKIIFANNLFVKVMGYSSQDEIAGKHHSIFTKGIYKSEEDYCAFWENLKKGEVFSDEITRVKRDGSLVYLQATYNPIFNQNGDVYRVMKIATDITESYNQRVEIEKQNTYLEHAAKILRHDMHSGINTYIPRGISSLERRLKPEDIERLKIESPLKMIKEGLAHAQKVYKGVYEFTNLVKKDIVLTRDIHDLKKILGDYLSSTAYKHQVIIEDLGSLSVNEPLFCTAIDNLIRNGLKYNDSNTKIVSIYKKDNYIIVEDNGRGLTKEEFNHLSQPYVRKEGQAESGSGLGLNICIAILKEHGFSVDCEKKSEGGSILKIKID